MAEADAGTHLTLLGTGEIVTEDRLPELYAYPENLASSWVRSNFISSLDGGATVDGKSGDLAGPGDRALFQVMRDLADVIVVGAGTVRAENYGGAKLGVAARQSRQARGQDEVPPICIISQSGRLERDMRVFTDTEVPPLVFTSLDTSGVTRERLGDSAEMLSGSGPDAGAVDLATVLRTLADRGLRRVLTEGGPRLHGTFIEDGLLDELCLSLAPTVVGGQARRIATGVSQVHTPMRPSMLLSDDAGYLYARYVRHTP